MNTRNRRPSYDDANLNNLSLSLYLRLKLKHSLTPLKFLLKIASMWITKLSIKKFYVTFFSSIAAHFNCRENLRRNFLHDFFQPFWIILKFQIILWFFSFLHIFCVVLLLLRNARLLSWNVVAGGLNARICFTNWRWGKGLEMFVCVFLFQRDWSFFHIFPSKLFFKFHFSHLSLSLSRIFHFFFAR